MAVIFILSMVLAIASLVSEIFSCKDTIKRETIDKRIRSSARTLALMSGTLLCNIIRDVYAILNNKYTIIIGLGTAFLIGWIVIEALTLHLLVNKKIESEK